MSDASEKEQTEESKARERGDRVLRAVKSFQGTDETSVHGAKRSNNEREEKETSVITTTSGNDHESASTSMLG